MIKREFCQLVERWRHDDSCCRPTAKELPVTFSHWPWEVQQSASSLDCSSMGSNSSSYATRSNDVNVAPPQLPGAPAIIRHDEPSDFLRVKSTAIIKEDLAPKARARNGLEALPPFPLSPARWYRVSDASSKVEPAPSRSTLESGPEGNTMKPDHARHHFSENVQSYGARYSGGPRGRCWSER